MLEKSYMTQTKSQTNKVKKGNPDYKKSGHIPYQIRRQFLCPSNDMEKLIERGLKNLAWLKHLLHNSGNAAMIDYAELRLMYSQSITELERKECLELISQHPVRNGKKW